MGKLKRKYNWKARQSSVPEANAQEKVNVEVDINTHDDKYDSSNALILPAAKKQKKDTVEPKSKQRKPLTKKERKKLNQILESRKKKANRAEILEKLQEVQASQEQLKLMTSIATIQTRGLKKHFMDKTSDKPISSLRRSKLKLQNVNRIEIKDDNVVGFDQSSSESSEDEDENEEEEESLKDDDVDNKTANEIKSAEVETVQRSVETDVQETVKTNLPMQDKVEELEKEKETKPKPPSKPVVFVNVNRDPEIQAFRLKLPILAEEQIIMECINEHNVVVICGETGSGKTTQVPQFLYEAGYTADGKMIGVTEPRRIAATSMSQRVAKELNLKKEVSYQIRYEGNVSSETRIKFMTDGVLLKELQKDFLLLKYSVIIIDEAHERSVFSDILIGLLSRIVPLRNKQNNPLKLIIMSATLRVEDFTENQRLFKIPPPILKVDSRQYPVTIHFNKRTNEDYVSEAYKKVCKIHRQLPTGGILVFLTGQQEVNSLCRKLRRAFPFNKHQNYDNKTLQENKNDDDNLDDVKQFKKSHKNNKKKGLTLTLTLANVTPRINLDDYSVNPLDEELLQEVSTKDEDDLDSSEDEMIETSSNLSEPLYVLPLYSLLSPEKQAKVFGEPPPGSRLCVIATNVAETSLTIPNIVYVVDSGKMKTRLYDKVTGVSAFSILWTSQASSDQRAGRAGRTGPGHCYRLYSSAVFVDEFPKFSEPEITRKPVDDLLLQMKSLGIDKVINFPFPSTPDIEALKGAEKRLILLGALEVPAKSLRYKEAKKLEWSAKVTPLGHAMASFPLSPRYAKMLALSHQQNLLPYTVAIVSALTVQEIFIDPQLAGTLDSEEGDLLNEKQKKWKQIMKTWAGQGQSLELGDAMILLKAVGACEFSGCTSKFCDVHGLRYKAMVEIRKLRVQLTNEVNLAIPNLNLSVDPKMPPPTEEQCKLLRQLMLTGMVDHVARKIPDEEISDVDKKQMKNAYMCLELETPVFIHPKSVLHKESPPLVIYQEIFETSRLFMRGVTSIETEWLPVYAPTLCTFSKPLEDPAPTYDRETDRVLCHMTSTFGRLSWPLPSCELDYPESLDKFKWFARFFLEGQVLKSLAKYKTSYLSPPATMVKSWAKLQPRTESLLQALVKENVTSKSQLQKIWKTNDKYLLKEFREWLPQSMYYEAEMSWPPK